MLYLVVKAKKLDKEEVSLLEKIASYLDIKEYEIVNVAYGDIPTDNYGSFYISFGEEASLVLGSKVRASRVLKINNINELQDKEDNKDSRLESFGKLKDFKEYIKITSKELPDLTIEQLTNLKIDKDIVEFDCLDSEGKKVIVHIEDVNELILIKVLKEYFKKVQVKKREDNGKAKAD